MPRKEFLNFIIKIKLYHFQTFVVCLVFFLFLVRCRCAHLYIYISSSCIFANNNSLWCLCLLGICSRFIGMLCGWLYYTIRSALSFASPAMHSIGMYSENHVRNTFAVLN